MKKSCAFCDFVTNDEALFAEHVALIHGWGKPPLRTTTTTRPPVEQTGDTIYCYTCATPNLPTASRCVSCAAALVPGDTARRVGHVYALNELNVLRERGLIDEATAERLRRHHLAALGQQAHAAAPVVVVSTPAEAPAHPTAITRPPLAAQMAPSPPKPTKPPAPPTPSLFSPERAPSLLLYVGAFLIVVAALIFVNVSGEQITGSVKLGMFIAGSVGFLGVGLYCHRKPRVLEAGRTFVAIGALLVPLDFVAYWILVSQTTLSLSTMWTLGAAVSGALYAVLALAGYGRAYAFLFLVGALATALGIEWVAELRGEWLFVGVALVPTAIAIAHASLTGTARDRLVAPIAATSSKVGIALLALSALAILVLGAFGATQRVPLTATFLVAAVHSAYRARSGSSFHRWIAVGAPGAAAISLAYVLEAPAQTYGFALALVALAYGATGDALGLGTPVPVAPWVADRARVFALASAAGALLPLDAYWRAPFAGATALFIVAAGVGLTVAFARASTPLMRILVAAGVIVAQLAAVHLLLAFGAIDAGAAPYTGFVGRELALALLPLTVVFAGLVWAARRRRHVLTFEVIWMTLASGAAILWFAFADSPTATILGAAFAIAIVAGAWLLREPRGLWFAATAAAVSLVSLDRWILPPIEARTLAVAAVALAVYFPPQHPRVRASAFTPVLRQIGMLSAALAVAVGLGDIATTTGPTSIAGVPLRSLWLATVPAVVVCGVIGVTDGFLRHSEREVVGATVFFIAAVLMLIARAQPTEVEAYTMPVASYLAIVAGGVARWAPTIRAQIQTPLRIAAAVALVLPTYVVSWEREDLWRVAVVLGEALVLLRIATLLADTPLAWTSLALGALVVPRAAVAPLAFETLCAAFGALTIAFALAAPRFITWRAEPLTREAAELLGCVLLMLPALVRASARGADALDHGGTVLLLAVFVVALSLWLARRAVLLAGVAAAAAVSVLAVAESARAEAYVAGAGTALLVLAIFAPRYLKRQLPGVYLDVLAITSSIMVVLLAAERLRVGDPGSSARLAAIGLALIVLAIASHEPMPAYVGVATTAIVGAWAFLDPTAREFYAIIVGASLVTLTLVSLRFSPGLLEPRALEAMEVGGAVLFVGPSLIAAWTSDFFPRTPVVFVEIGVLLGIGVALHRRWLVGVALVALGLEAIRALIDAINRLPNYVLFATSGALLLAIGFILLLKREAWHEWTRQVVSWWSRI